MMKAYYHADIRIVTVFRDSLQTDFSCVLIGSHV
jgi:hypothetical protein